MSEPGLLARELVATIVADPEARRRLAAAVVAELPEPMNADEWMPAREAAGYLGLHPDTLRKYARAGLVPYEQSGEGCRLYFKRSALDHWRASGGIAAARAGLLRVA